MTMNEQQFFDLAMKAIADQASDAERAELDALLADKPEWKAEFERLRADARIVREVLPLVSATQATAGELPAYARGRLQTKVRETLGGQKTSPESTRESERNMMWRWRWVLGLASATAVVVFLMLTLVNRPTEPVIQVAMLDTAGATRGSEANETAELRRI